MSGNRWGPRTAAVRLPNWRVHPNAIGSLIRSRALRASGIDKQLRVRASDAAANLNSTVVSA
jgi:hypothetical protein